MATPIILGYPLPQINEVPPTRIIYRDIDVKVTGRPGNPANPQKIDVIYAQHDEPFSGIIDTFIAKAVKDYDKLPPRGLPFVGSPLDLNCQERCIVVFKLAADWNWWFNPAGDAFTTKADESQKYSNLVHVMRDGRKISSGNPIGEGCRLLYFTANCSPTPDYQDSFNLTVELKVDDGAVVRRTKLVIDPDVRHPGGSGDEPLPAPVR